MRPRVFPAEDPPPLPRVPVIWSSFNEAAGIPRGRRRQVQAKILSTPQLQ